MCLKIVLLLQESKQKNEIQVWSDQIAAEKDRSILWHWIRCESGKPNSGFIYDIMKRTVTNIIMLFDVVKRIN